MKKLTLPLVIVAVLALAGLYAIVNPAKDDLVIYCAHDAIYSEAILEHFTQKTGIKVTPRFDSEATKSLGLTELLVQEKDHPRCDVYWSN